MSCDRIQEWIMTDYLDDRLDQGQRKFIEDHLSRCESCREFAEVARETVVEPFAQTKRFSPPETLWAKIKETIEEEGTAERVPWMDQVIATARKVFPVPKPVFAFVTVCVLILMAGVATQTIRHKKTVDQIEYLAYLTQSTEEAAQKDTRGLGTWIEQYFL